MKPSRFLLGLFFILSGTVFFLINSGYGSWSLLWFIPQFWPVLLIFFGLSLLWKGPIPPWFGFSLILVLITLVIYIFVFSPDLINNSGNYIEKNQIKKEIILDAHPLCSHFRALFPAFTQFSLHTFYCV